MIARVNTIPSSTQELYVWYEICVGFYVETMAHISHQKKQAKQNIKQAAHKTILSFTSYIPINQPCLVAVKEVKA